MWSFDDLLSHSPECEISIDMLKHLFPEHEVQWDKLVSNSTMITLCVVGRAFFPGGDSVLCTPALNGEHPIKSDKSIKEQALEYDKKAGAVHEFDLPTSLTADISENNKFPITQIYVADPYAKTEEFKQFKLQHGSREEIEEIESEEEEGEFYCLDMSLWEPVRMDRGEYKGKHPVVTSQGNVAVGRKYAGQSVRVFVRKM